MFALVALDDQAGFEQLMARKTNRISARGALRRVAEGLETHPWMEPYLSEAD